MDNRTCFAAFLVLFFVTHTSPGNSELNGKDLGVYGKLYKIEEEDIVSYIKGKAKKIDMQALREKTNRSVKKSLLELSSVSLEVPTAQKERVRYIDSSVKVANPIYDHTGEIISLAGVVNPFDYVSLSKSILVLREDQVEKALEKISGNVEGKLILILTDGNVQRVSTLVGWTAYKASPLILRRLGVEKVPSLVNQKDRKLEVKEIVIK